MENIQTSKWVFPSSSLNNKELCMNIYQVKPIQDQVMTKTECIGTETRPGFWGIETKPWRRQGETQSRARPDQCESHSAWHDRMWNWIDVKDPHSYKNTYQHYQLKSTSPSLFNSHLKNFRQEDLYTITVLKLTNKADNAQAICEIPAIVTRQLNQRQSKAKFNA